MFSTQVIKVMMDHCELFQRSVEATAQKELEIIKASKKGKATEFVDVAGPTTTVLFSLACGITIAMGFATFGIASFCGAAVAGGTLVVKSVDKRKKQAGAKKIVQTLDEAANRESVDVSSYLNCLVKDVAKELSRIFEYQLFRLKNEQQVKILAECAVDLMLNLKKDDTLDRNTLLKKVLLGGKAKKKWKLLTSNDDEWFAPDVFGKPGLRRMIVGTDNTECLYTAYYVKPDGSCDTKTYGYRGQFLQMKVYDGKKEEATSERLAEFGEREKFGCEECSDCLRPSSGKYFVESDIDSEYHDKREEAFIYRPLHLLVQCPKVLHFVIENLSQNPSFADSVKTKIGFQDNNTLLLVYRQHVPGNVELNCSQAGQVPRASFTGLDFSHSDFTNSSFLGCDFTNCVMLFTKLTGANVSDSKFVETYISHSDLNGIKANGSTFIKTDILHSSVDGANLNSNLGGNCLDGTKISNANIIEKTASSNMNGSKYTTIIHMVAYF